MPGFTLDEVRARTLKERDSWLTVYLVDPIAVRLVRLIANRTSITPNQLTVAALFLGLGAAVCFAFGYWQLLLLGAALYYVCFLVDCTDGKLARLTGSESLFGAWMDYVSDRFRVLVCVVALMGGQYRETGNVAFVWLALAVVFLDMLRYLNALQVYKVRREMRSHLAAALERARATLSMLEPEGDATGSATGGGGRTMSDGGEQAVVGLGIVDEPAERAFAGLLRTGGGDAGEVYLGPEVLGGDRREVSAARRLPFQEQAAVAAGVEVLDEEWRQNTSSAGFLEDRRDAGVARVEDAPPFDAKGKTFLEAVMLGAGPGFFETLRIPVLLGRAFNARDRADTPRVAVITERMARAYFGGVNAGGRRFRSANDPNSWTEGIGVVRDTGTGRFEDDVLDPISPPFYVSYTQTGALPTTVVARTSGDAATLVAEMVRRSREFAADLGRRRTVLQFSDRPVPRSVIEACIEAAGTAPVPVTVARVERKPMPLRILAIGTVEASSSVAVRSQITGELTSVHFEEGDDVARILLKLQPKAAAALERLTSDQVGRQVTIILKEEVVTMHKIREAIRGGEVQITSCAPGMPSAIVVAPPSNAPSTPSIKELPNLNESATASNWLRGM